MLGYLTAIEYISSELSKGEVLIFRRANTGRGFFKKGGHDLENLNISTPTREKQGRQVRKQGDRRRTALMSSTGKKYATISQSKARLGDYWITLAAVSNLGRSQYYTSLNRAYPAPRGDSFQRKTGYVQQDLHLATSTIREALRLSALQPRYIPKQVKLNCVNTVIDGLTCMHMLMRWLVFLTKD
ncbi:hypothetical protein EYZ11_007350 [Aspergillus tanneri]|uniref:Uncharacterized protein n=1 Tax=Aspergillus tanneri TaxID=1220188 RepID=A0A4S3JIV1_9EURO|nr:hypothetical protein EYZ11_007350 [Aspergillus tanneri]